MAVLPWSWSRPPPQLRKAHLSELVLPVSPTWRGALRGRWELRGRWRPLGSVPSPGRGQRLGSDLTAPWHGFASLAYGIDAITSVQGVLSARSTHGPFTSATVDQDPASWRGGHSRASVGMGPMGPAPWAPAELLDTTTMASPLRLSLGFRVAGTPRSQATAPGTWDLHWAHGATSGKSLGVAVGWAIFTDSSLLTSVAWAWGSDPGFQAGGVFQGTPQNPTSQLPPVGFSPGDSVSGQEQEMQFPMRLTKLHRPPGGASMAAT